MKIKTALILACIIVSACHNSPQNKKNKSGSDLFAHSIMTNRTSVIYFLNTECPICQKYQGSFKSTYQEFNRDFEFYYVFPGQQTEQSIINFCKYDSIPLDHVVLDKNAEISLKTYKAIITPQALIVNADHNLLYTGKIDDRFAVLGSHKTKASINYLEKALFSLRKNETVEINKTNPVGCFIEPD